MEFQILKYEKSSTGTFTKNRFQILKYETTVVLPVTPRVRSQDAGRS
jgi:hypothetical protein